jgi:hypothetical protein
LKPTTLDGVEADYQFRCEGDKLKKEITVATTHVCNTQSLK